MTPPHVHKNINQQIEGNKNQNATNDLLECIWKQLSFCSVLKISSFSFRAAVVNNSSFLRQEITEHMPVNQSGFH